MSTSRFKHMLVRMCPEEKAIAVALATLMISQFLPWFSVQLNSNQANIENGISGSLGVIGFVILLMSLIGLLYLTSDYLNLPAPKLSYAREQVILFFSAESAFLALLCIAIYKRMSLEYTQADLRFGLYLTVASSIIAAFSSYALKQKVALSDPQHQPREAEPQHEPLDEPLDEEDEFLYEDEEIEDVSIESQNTPEDQQNFFMKEAGLQEPPPNPESNKPQPYNFYED